MGKIPFVNDINPFYFGVSRQELYGCHHLPQSSHTRSCIVVLCYPIGQEYIRSHRAFYQLAVRLSRAGFHVLRFDYHGCGDSSGDFEEGSLLQWTNDIHTAIKEMQNRCGLTSVCLIGLRIGATLALQVAANCLSVHGIVLWEPIFDGKLYLEELVNSHRSYVSHQLRFIDKWRFKRPEMPDEILGFPLTPKLRRELELINLDDSEFRSETKLLAVCNSDDLGGTCALERFIQSHPHADYQVIADPRLWMVELYKRIIPFNTLKHLVKWVDKVHS